MKIYLPTNLYGEIMGYVYACDIEVSGMGQAVRYKDGYKITKVHVVEQECTSVTTEMDAAALGKLEYKCMTEYEEYGELMWWWHSHVDMPARWSGTDTNTQDDMTRDGGIMIATVFNKRHDTQSAYMQGGDDRHAPIVNRDIELVLIPTDDAAQTIADNVTKKKVKARPKRTSIDAYTKDSVLNLAADMFRKQPQSIDKLFADVRLNTGLDVDTTKEYYDEFMACSNGKEPSFEELVEYIEIEINGGIYE